MRTTKPDILDLQQLQTPLSRTQKICVILIILALHSGSVLMLFNTQTNTQAWHDFVQQVTQQAVEQDTLPTAAQRAQYAKQHPEKTPEEIEEWGAMKAHASRFGAAVLFQEEPEFIAQEEPIAATADAQTAEKSSSGANQQANATAPTPQATQEPTRTSAATAQEQPAQKLLQQLEQASTQLIAVNEKEPESTADQVSTAETLHAHLQSDEATNTQHNEAQQAQKNTPDPETYIPGWGKKDATPITKKMVSMAQLARGFLDNIKNEGTHAVTMIGGKEGGRITAEQLKVERYVQRLNWYLQNSFRINRSRYREQHPSTTAEVYLVLERSGRIKDVRILRSSGDLLLDDHTLFVFKDAGTSFPPVPQYLPQDPFAITYVVEYSVFDAPPQKAGFKIFS